MLSFAGLVVVLAAGCASAQTPVIQAPNLPPFPPSFPANAASTSLQVTLKGTDVPTTLAPEQNRLWVATLVCRTLQLMSGGTCQVDKTAVVLPDSMVISMSMMPGKNSGTVLDLQDTLRNNAQQALQDNAANWFAAYGVK